MLITGGRVSIGRYWVMGSHSAQSGRASQRLKSLSLLVEISDPVAFPDILGKSVTLMILLVTVVLSCLGAKL